MIVWSLASQVASLPRLDMKLPSLVTSAASPLRSLLQSLTEAVFTRGGLESIMLRVEILVVIVVSTVV